MKVVHTEQMLRRRRTLIGALIAWLIVSGIIVVINCHIKFGELSLASSISMYVGYEAWSVVVFTVMNSALVICMGRYLLPMHKRMGRSWLALLIAILTSFIIVSVCPWGFYDDGSGIVSITHRVVAYAMFLTMAPFVILTMRRRAGEKRVRRAGQVFLTYVGLCALAFIVQFAKSVIMQVSFELPWTSVVLLVEAGYIVLMIAVVLSINITCAIKQSAAS